MEQQEIMFRINMMEQQMQQLQQQLEAVGRGIGELGSLDAGLEEIPDSEGKDVLAQVGKGIYAKARITSSELMVNVGDNNFVSKSVEETKKLIEGQIVKLEEIEGELEENIESLNSEFAKLLHDYQNQERK